MQTDATLLANNPQHCWMLHVASVCTPCGMLLRVFGSCWIRLHTTTNTDATTPTKVGSCCVRLHVSKWYTQTDIILFAYDSQHCWMLHVASVCTPCCMSLPVVGSCCAKFETGHTFIYVQTDATTPNKVASVCTWLDYKPVPEFWTLMNLKAPCKRTQHCWPLENI